MGVLLLGKAGPTHVSSIVGMDDDVLILPLDPSDLADQEPATTSPQDGSGWWPVIAVVAVLIAVFALIRNDGEPRVAESPETADPSTTVPVTSEAAVTVPVVGEPDGSAFDPPLLGRVWNSELVIIDTDVVTFIDLNNGEIRSADLAEDVLPPVAFYDDSIAFSDGRDLIRVTPGFAKRRYIRHDARNVIPLPGQPLAFHDADSPNQAEVVVVGPIMGSITTLADGAMPWAMWDGSVLVSIGQRIELVPLDRSEPELVAEGTLLAASGDALLYEYCPDGSSEQSADDQPPGATDCEVRLVRRSGAETPSVDLPDEILAISLAPFGNHVIYVAETEPGTGTAVVFVAGTDGSGEAVPVTAVDTESAGDWPAPMWSQDGTVVVVAGRDGQALIDVEDGGALDIEQVVGDLEGDIVGFVSIRHLSGTSGAATEIAP